MSALLDLSVKIVRSHPNDAISSSRDSGAWDRKHKRHYRNIRAGLRRHSGERLRFLTLTSSEATVNISECFVVLKKRISRLTPLKLRLLGFVDRRALRYYYPNKRLNASLDFVYYKILTREGARGVLHVLYFGDFIPRDWLVKNWEDIAGAYIVDIRECDRVYNDRGLACYIVNQYLAGQSLLDRGSCSWAWVCRGFARLWRYVVLKHSRLTSDRNVWGYPIREYDMAKILWEWEIYLGYIRENNIIVWNFDDSKQLTLQAFFARV